MSTVKDLSGNNGFPLDPRVAERNVPKIGNVQVKAYTTTTAIDNAVQSNKVRVVCTTTAHIVVGPTPVATTSDTYMPADTPLEILVTKGVDKIAAVQAATGGNLHVTELL